MTDNTDVTVIDEMDNAFNEMVKADSDVENIESSAVDIEETHAESHEQASGSDSKALDNDTGIKQEDITEKLKAIEAERDQWRHKYQSDAGRVSAYQRKIDELQAQLQTTQTANPKGSGMTDEQWAKFEEEYPEIATAVNAKLQQVNEVNSAAMNTLTRVQQQIAPLAEQEELKAEQSRIALLEEQHPNWRTKVQSPEFKLWLDQQPKAVRGLAFSDAVEDAAYLISSFDRAGLLPKVAESRNDRLQQNLGVKSKGNRSGATSVPQDYDDAFAYFANRS